MAIKINGSTIIDDSRKGVNFDSVGIGTTNPIEALDVQGTVHISRAASSFSPHLELFAENTFGAQITAKSETDFPNLIFRSEYGGAGPEYFSGVINEQLSNGDYKTGLKLNDNKPVLFGTDNDALIEYDATPGVLEIKTVGAEPITVHTNFTERIRVNLDGNIGIGSTQPTAKLDVDGTLNVSGISTLADSIKFESSGSNDAVIDLVPTGTLFIRAGAVNDGKIRLQGHTGYDNIICNANGILGTTELHYAASGGTGGKKLETTGYGVTVTGGLEVSGIATATSFSGDGSQLTGIEAASFLFNTGITSSVSTVATGVGSTILTLPLLDGRKYIIHSILASNIAVGNTEVNFVGAFDFNGGETSYFANQIPIPTGTSVEMLKQPQVLNPSDKIIVRSTDFDRVGANDIIDVYVSYEEKTSTDLIGVGLGDVGLGVTTTTTIYTSSTYPSVVQSIRLVNRVDTGPKIASVSISNGVSTTFLVDNLIVPKYGSVEILDNPKSIQTNDVVQVQLEEGASINVQLSAKKITS